MLDRLRAKLLNMPSKWAPAMVGCRTVPEALTRLEPAVADAMEELGSTADDIERDDAVDDAGPERSAA